MMSVTPLALTILSPALLQDSSGFPRLMEKLQSYARIVEEVPSDDERRWGS